MKQNTEQLKKDIEEILVARGGCTASYDSECTYQDYNKPNFWYYEVERIMELFASHLISSDEIKREAETEEEKVAVEEKFNRVVGMAMMFYPKSQELIDEIRALEAYLTQSKEGGE